jgi:hypothetical protein
MNRAKGAVLRGCSPTLFRSASVRFTQRGRPCLTQARRRNTPRAWCPVGVTRGMDRAPYGLTVGDRVECHPKRRPRALHTAAELRPAEAHHLAGLFVSYRLTERNDTPFRLCRQLAQYSCATLRPSPDGRPTCQSVAATNSADSIGPCREPRHTPTRRSLRTDAPSSAGPRLHHVDRVRRLAHRHPRLNRDPQLLEIRDLFIARRPRAPRRI